MVAVVMTAYSLLLRRTSRWLQMSRLADVAGRPRVMLLLFAAFFVVPAARDARLQHPRSRQRRRPHVATRGRTWSRTTTLRAAIITSLLLALFTVVLMLVLLVPTMIWVRLRVPRATRLVEFLCLLPLTIPALVIVVGLKNVYAVGDLLRSATPPLTLTFAYVVLVLPYAYRAIDAALSGDRRHHPRRGGPLARAPAGRR